MRLLIVKQIIKDTNAMFISLSVIHSETYIPSMVKEFLGLS